MALCLFRNTCYHNGMARRTRWSESLIETRLLVHVDDLGRMPSCRELAEREGDHRLATAIVRYGGYVAWAKRLGVRLKESETRTGRIWEDHEERFFLEAGFKVIRQRHRTPYDLLVNDLRVDVKSATWSDYEVVSGFVFAGLKRGVDCDVFDLVCVNDDEVSHRFVIPAKDVEVVTITISPRVIAGSGKWSRFEDRLDFLHE